jgi:uncharacterized protein YecE (DUF72 family)
MIRIGTSGWVYPHWLDRFYPRSLPPEDQLDFYAREFPTVEINASFYRLPTREQFAAWAEQTRGHLGFCCAVKASRYLTHLKKLRDADEGLRRLVEHAEGLGTQLGPYLYQLPPHWRANPERLRAFVGLLPQRYPAAFEFRDPSWFASDVLRILEDAGCALVVAVGGEHHTPLDVPPVGPFAYLRFHGGLYGTGFTDGELAFWADRIAALADHDVYVYFNNDPEGHAIYDARRLHALLAARALPLAV